MTTLAAWLRKAPRGTARRWDRMGILSHTTLHRVQHGALIRDYEVARRVSEATGGEVSIADLCEKRKRGVR